MDFRLFDNSLTRLIESASEFIAKWMADTFGFGYFLRFYRNPDNKILIIERVEGFRFVFAWDGGIQIMKLEKGIFKIFDRAIRIDNLVYEIRKDDRILKHKKTGVYIHLRPGAYLYDEPLEDCEEVSYDNFGPYSVNSYRLYKYDVEGTMPLYNPKYEDLMHFYHASRGIRI